MPIGIPTSAKVQIDIFLYCMHDFEIIAVTLIMTFLEIISVIILYVICVA